MTRALHQHLDALLRQHDIAASVHNDPVRLAHRYTAPQDVEIAALLASCYAYGRVELFLGLLDQLADIMDRHGGPRAFVDAFDRGAMAAPLADLNYRWTRGSDLIDFMAALQRCLRDDAPLSTLFAGPDAYSALKHASEAITDAAIALADEHITQPVHLSRGLRYFLPSPVGGSACKRGNLFLRWMVRPADGVDLGLWTHIRPDALIIPVDRHIQRISPLIGLVPSATGSWKSAVAITRALTALCATDPVRYDFALAHLGISGGCTGALVPDICSTCAVRPLCRHGSALAP